MDHPDASRPAVRLSNQARELLRVIRLNQWAAPAAVPLILLVWWQYRSPVLVAMALLVATTTAFQRAATRHARNGDVQGGVRALVLGIWLPTFGMAVLVPEVWTVTVVFAVLSVLLALPFVDSSRVRALIAVASGILAVGGWFHAFPRVHGFPPEAPESLIRGMVSVGSGIGAMLCMYSAWQTNSRLFEALGRLRASERDLEAKVAERTADLLQSREELAEARDAALAANRHKSAFLANMSHELRTPLNAIIGFSEMLEEEVFGDLNAKQKEYVHDIHGSGTHLLSLINDVLDLSKIEAGRHELSVAPFPLDEVLDVALTMTREKAGMKGIEQRRDFDDALGEIEADERAVKQVVTNLLSNAVKFTEPGGTVTLRVRRRPEEVEIAVIDTGIGIAAEDQEAVFEEFRQVGSSRERHAEGTGLGLALVRRLVELHGGRVRLESEPGRGSTFTVTLPHRVPDELR